MAVVLEALNLAAAVLLLVLGTAACLTAHNAIKRVIALFLAMIGAVLAVLALRSNMGALIAGATVTAAYAVVGIALLVRLQEDYALVESDGIDAADLSDEPPESGA